MCRAGQDERTRRCLAGQVDRERRAAPSFVPPAGNPAARGYARLREDLTHERTRSCQRLEKLLADPLARFHDFAPDYHARRIDIETPGTEPLAPSSPQSAIG
jgi:hypothetical protein